MYHSVDSNLLSSGHEMLSNVVQGCPMNGQKSTNIQIILVHRLRILFDEPAELR